MDDGNAKGSNQANTKSADDTANSDTQAFAVDGGKHLPSNYASNDTPAYLHNHVEDTSEFCWPVAHEIATNNL